MKFLWISAMAAVYSFAANSIDIKGLVQDYAKSPVSGAGISLVGEGLKTETDDKGAFALVKVAENAEESVPDSAENTQLVNRRLYATGVYDAYAYRAFDLNGRAVSKNRMTRNANCYLLKPVAYVGEGAAVAYAGENRRVVCRQLEHLYGQGKVARVWSRLSRVRKLRIEALSKLAYVKKRLPYGGRF